MRVRADKFLLRNGKQKCLSANLTTSVIEVVNCQDAIHWTVNEDAFEDSSNTIVVSPYGYEDLCANVDEDGAFRLVDCDVEEGSVTYFCNPSRCSFTFIISFRNQHMLTFIFSIFHIQQGNIAVAHY